MSYATIRTSIRTNGLAYTTRHAIERGDVTALGIIDTIVNRCVKPTDWLAMRAHWSKTEPQAIRLTTWINL